ncbi:MAG: hypothetical protein ACI837_000394 [Crocinitomicaceae bacterium]|jgi:hypothetical protein
MKRILLFAITLFSLTAYSQDCERIVQDCEELLNNDTKTNFVSDGQVYTAFLDREKAEFKTTFYGGTTYRIAATAGSKEDFVIFTVKDPDGQILFSNRNYKNAPFWDFNIRETLPVTIEAELDLDLKVTGCVVMMIGFQK